MVRLARDQRDAEVREGTRRPGAAGLTSTRPLSPDEITISRDEALDIAACLFEAVRLAEQASRFVETVEADRLHQMITMLVDAGELHAHRDERGHLHVPAHEVTARIQHA